MRKKNSIFVLVLCFFILLFVNLIEKENHQIQVVNNDNSDTTLKEIQEIKKISNEQNSVNTGTVQRINYVQEPKNTEEVLEYQDASTIIKNLRTKYNNNDIMARLRILNTNYSTPIAQSNNNKYYLNHLPNKKYSILGTPLLDYRVNLNKDRKLLIYGHNSSRIKMPFDIMENYDNQKYIDNYKYIELVTEKEYRFFEVFSVYVETSDWTYYNYLYFSSDEDFFDHINDLKDKSLYETDVELTEDDNILILQTCSTNKKYRKYAHKYLLIVLKEVTL